MDSGVYINLIKEDSILSNHKNIKFGKKFYIGIDQHQTTEAVYIPYHGKTHLFHIISVDFPLTEFGIIGLLLLKKYDRESLTPKFLIPGKNKLPLYESGHYIRTNSQQVCLIQLKDTDSNV